jgi:hypothetical protein
MKRTYFVIITVLMFVTMAAAQVRDPRASLVPPDGGAPIDYKFALAGVELATGTFDKIDDKRWGNVYVLEGSSGKTQAQLTVTLDYISGLPDPLNGNHVTDGSWTLAVYRNGEYLGNLYGQVAGGELHWKMARDGSIGFGDFDLKFFVTGGTGKFETAGGAGGILSATTDYRQPKPVSQGMLKITF